MIIFVPTPLPSDVKRDGFGKTMRILEVLLREHQRHISNAHFDRSAVSEHAHVVRHGVNRNGAPVLDHRSNRREGKIKETLHIRRQVEIRPS